MSLDLAFQILPRLLAVSILIQTVEHFYLMHRMNWHWSVYHSILPPSLLRVLIPPVYRLLLAVQAIESISIIISPTKGAMIALFLTTTLILIRHRGTFNGGSDYMTTVSVSALAVGFIYPPWKGAAIWYIACDVLFSYLMAGIAKLQSPHWRKGDALQQFLKTSVYGRFSSKLANSELGQKADGQTGFRQQLKRDSFQANPSDPPQEAENSSLGGSASRMDRLAKILSWAVMLWEVSFPLSLIHPAVCAVYLGLGVIFHLSNFYLFGLNRFVWAWIATYPAIVYCSYNHEILRLW